mgnify:CR=1 FL=1
MTVRNNRFSRNALRFASATLAAACALWGVASVAETAGNGNSLTAEEINKVLSHGPWPASTSPAKDPTNRASGNADAIEFGTRLFFDQRLSGDGKIACDGNHYAEVGCTSDGFVVAWDRQTNAPTPESVERIRHYFAVHQTVRELFTSLATTPTNHAQVPLLLRP